MPFSHALLMQSHSSIMYYLCMKKVPFCHKNKLQNQTYVQECIDRRACRLVEKCFPVSGTLRIILIKTVQSGHRGRLSCIRTRMWIRRICVFKLCRHDFWQNEFEASDDEIFSWFLLQSVYDTDFIVNWKRKFCSYYSEISQYKIICFFVRVYKKYSN